jgi:hypothetical protein
VGLRADLRGIGETWTAQLQRLESINVTVQGIGQEVIAYAGTMMKEHVAQVICDSVAELRDRVTSIASELQKQLTDSFQTSLSQEMGRLRSGVEAVQRAVEGQSQSNLERILERLQDVVSGGFQSQSVDMGRQIAQLANVLPRLEEQFAAMSASIGRSADSWGQQNAQAVQGLSARVGELLSQFDTIGKGIDGAAQRLFEASDRTTQGLGAAVAEQAQSTHAQLSEFRRAAAEDGAAFEKRVQAFSDSIEKTQSELTASTGAMRDTAAELLRVLSGLRENSEVTQSSIRSMDGTAKQLTDGAKSLERTFAERGKIVEREQQLLAGQRQAVDSLERVLSGVLKSYEVAVTSQANQLAESWTRLARDVQQVIEGAGQSLSESVEELGLKVDDLKTTLRPDELRQIA